MRLLQTTTTMASRHFEWYISTAISPFWKFRVLNFLLTTTSQRLIFLYIIFISIFITPFLVVDNKSRKLLGERIKHEGEEKRGEKKVGSRSWPPSFVSDPVTMCTLSRFLADVGQVLYLKARDGARSFLYLTKLGAITLMSRWSDTRKLKGTFHSCGIQIMPECFFLRL